MYVSDPKRRIEYLGDGVVNLPPGASCVWITDGYEQEEDEDGHDLRDKPWRSEGHPKKMIFVAFGHWQIIMGDQERCFDLDEKDPDFFWDFPEELRWYSEPRELPEDGHFHWFDCSGHDGYRIHCEGWQDPQRTAGATVATEAAEGQDFNSLELKHA